SGAGLRAWNCPIPAVAFGARSFGFGTGATRRRTGQSSAIVVNARTGDDAPKSDPYGDLGNGEARDRDSRFRRNLDRSRRCDRGPSTVAELAPTGRITSGIRTRSAVFESARDRPAFDHYVPTPSSTRR